MKKINFIGYYSKYGNYKVTEDLIGKYILATNYLNLGGYSFVGIIIDVYRVKIVKRLDTDKSHSTTNHIFKYMSDRTYYLLDNEEALGYLL